jgi:hypothetical protein
MGEWRYRSIIFWPRHLLEVSGQLHGSAAVFYFVAIKIIKIVCLFDGHEEKDGE